MTTAEKARTLPPSAELEEPHCTAPPPPPQVTSSTGVVVHFSHEEFTTCRVMEKHLRVLASRCPTVKFLSINAAKAPFFTAKLRVKVLPTLVFFIDGIAVGRQTGFEGLTGGGDAPSVVSTFGSHRAGAPAAAEDDFPTHRLLRVLRISGVMGPAARAEALEAGDEDDDDDEWGGGGGDGAGWALRGAPAGSGGKALATSSLHAARAARDASYYDIGE